MIIYLIRVMGGSASHYYSTQGQYVECCPGFKVIDRAFFREIVTRIEGHIIHPNMSGVGHVQMSNHCDNSP
ncbi:hypothetical protein AFLA_006253 [Aspergillus flavus NRRL3357]|nr:hypothetical protein AFLA_006253 [Aspergillus flavus NRRL3357]